VNTEAIIGRRIIFPEALSEEEWNALTDIAIAVPIKMFGDLNGGILDTRRTVLTRITAPEGMENPEGGVFDVDSVADYYTTEETAELLDIGAVRALGYVVEQWRSRDLIRDLTEACKATEAEL